MFFLGSAVFNALITAPNAEQVYLSFAGMSWPSLMGPGETLDSGALIAGGTKTGKVCSEDTAEKGQFVFIYKPNAFEATRGIWLFTV